MPAEMLAQLIGDANRRGGGANLDGLNQSALDDVLLPPLPEPNPNTAELSMLRKNVKALYEDARSHILMERSAASLVSELQTKVEALQKAFRQLAEVAIEELEGLRADVERQVDEIANFRRLEPRLRSLEQQMSRFGAWQEQQAATAAEVARLQTAEAERDRREAIVEGELRDVRHMAEHDRTALQKAVRALNAATAAVEERQVRSESAIRANREAIEALAARQEVLDDEVGILADAMHEATVGAGGILLPRPIRPRFMNGVPKPPASGVGGGERTAPDASAMSATETAAAAEKLAAAATARLAGGSSHPASIAIARLTEATDQRFEHRVAGGTRTPAAEAAEWASVGGAGLRSAARDAAASRLLEAQRRLDYEAALHAARSHRQRVTGIASAGE